MPATQQWQIEENKAYDAVSKTLASLTLNTSMSNENWYRAACYEARKLQRKKKAVKQRARAAGQAKGSSGITVLNKDSIDPITVKKTNPLELHHIFEMQKKHKFIVDTATSAIDCKIDKYTAAQLKKAKRKPGKRDAHPKFDFPYTLKNHATRREVEGWQHNKKMLNKLVATSKPAVDAYLDKYQQKQLELAEQSLNRDEHPGYDFPLSLKNYATRREVDGWERTQKKLDYLVSTSQSATSTTLEKHWQRRLTEIDHKKKFPDRFPSFPQYPITLKNKHSRNEIAGWAYDDKKLESLISTAKVQIDSRWDSKNILIPDKFKLKRSKGKGGGSGNGSKRRMGRTRTQSGRPSTADSVYSRRTNAERHVTKFATRSNRQSRR